MSSLSLDALTCVKARIDDTICTLQIHRPNDNNTINDTLIDECHQVLTMCEARCSVVVVQGLPEVFCFGADFAGIKRSLASNAAAQGDPRPLYDLWLRLATGPCISVAHVRGKANAGGVGFVAACDIVLADESAVFSLSELLFGLYPACVLPYLVRRVGHAKAQYMTLMTQPVTVKQAVEWGLVDACEPNGDALLRKHLMRLRRLSKSAVAAYKAYMNRLSPPLESFRDLAVDANTAIFSDPQNLRNISRYVETGRFPWDAD